MEQKLCKDCRWAQPAKLKTDWLCLSPRNTGEPDLVTGATASPKFYWCHIHRMGPSGCGEAGKWWEAK